MTSGPDGGGDAAVGNGSTTGSPDPPGTAHGGRLDVVVLAGGTGRRLGVYRTAALTQCVAPGGAALRDISVRRALGGLSVVHVDLGELRSAARDLDTWEDVRAWDRH